MRTKLAAALALAFAFTAAARAADNNFRHAGAQPRGESFWHPAPSSTDPFWHPAPSSADPFWHPAPNQAVPKPQVVRNPLWRRPARSAHPQRFRFRGQNFVVISAPLYASPWLYYPYALGGDWGPSYYVPGEPGYFLYYCADPAGYYPEVQGCASGWLQTVPDDAPETGPGD